MMYNIHMIVYHDDSEDGDGRSVSHSQFCCGPFAHRREAQAEAKRLEVLHEGTYGFKIVEIV